MRLDAPGRVAACIATERSTDAPCDSSQADDLEAEDELFSELAKREAAAEVLCSHALARLAHRQKVAQEAAAITLCAHARTLVARIAYKQMVLRQAAAEIVARQAAAERLCAHARGSVARIAYKQKMLEQAAAERLCASARAFVARQRVDAARRLQVALELAEELRAAEKVMGFER